MNALIDLTEKNWSKISIIEKIIGTFLDLGQAFYMVNHRLLLKKLAAYGARGIVFQLMASFLQNTKQFLQIDEKISEVRDINVGVPQ